MGRGATWGLWAVVALGVGCGASPAQAPEGQGERAEVEQAVSAGETRWVRQGVSTFGGNTFIEDMAIDRDGAHLLVGNYSGGVRFEGVTLPAVRNSATTSSFLVKYAADGRLLWAREFTGAVEDPEAGSLTVFRAVAVDRERRITVVGEASGVGTDFGDGRPLPEGPFLAQFSASGDFLWARHLPGDGFGFRPSLHVDRSDRLLLVGSIDGRMDFGGGTRRAFPESAFIAKYGPDGAYLWDRVFDTADTSHFTGVTADSEDNVYVSGFFLESARFGGGLLRSVEPDFEAPVVASYTPSGAHRWSRTLPGMTESAALQSVAVHGNRVVVGGDFRGAFRFAGRTFSVTGRGRGMVLAYTRAGEERWGREVGAIVLEVEADLEDDMTVLTLDGPVFRVVKLDRVEGALRWTRGFEARPTIQLSLAVSRHGEVAVGGSFREVLDLGTETLTPAIPDRFDTFLLHLGP